MSLWERLPEAVRAAIGDDPGLGDVVRFLRRAQPGRTVYVPKGPGVEASTLRREYERIRERGVRKGDSCRIVAKRHAVSVKTVRRAVKGLG